MKTAKVLFILKRRDDYSVTMHSHVGLSTGLYNSASFVVDMLNNDLGIESVLEVAIDNNCVDRLVTLHKPTHVIIEALWIVPSKFAVLTQLHPNVKWIIRLHSELPFMAGEGPAMNWIGDYIGFKNISIGINAPRMLNEIQTFLKCSRNWTEKETQTRVFYLPNYYPQDYKHKDFGSITKPQVDVSCFGAVRPLKNHLLQAIASIKFANSIGKKLHYHINSGRIEMKGDPVLNNLRGLFQHMADSGHQLIGHEWTPREDFLKLCSTMDIGLQCNFSETFNIVSADLISQGVPIVGSSEIPWASPLFNARPSESDEIANAMHRSYCFPKINVWLNQRSLTRYTKQTVAVWHKYFNNTT